MRSYLGVSGSILIAVLVGMPLHTRPGVSHTYNSELGVITAKAPVYPEVYRGTLGRIDISGEVQVEVQIDNKGVVTSATALNGPLQLRSFAATAAEHWRFTPVDSGPTRRATLTFVFSVAPHNAPAEELTPTFEPPYKVEVKQRAVKAR